MCLNVYRYKPFHNNKDHNIIEHFTFSRKCGPSSYIGNSSSAYNAV